MNWTCRFLGAIGFLVFCVVGFGTWVALPPYGPPWWSPFAAAAVIPAIMATVLLILEGPSIFTKKDRK